MKKILTCTALGLFAMLVLAGCRASQQTEPRLTVAVSIAPLADFTRQIGAEHVDVVTIVPGGANPHSFEITPDIISRCSNASVLVLNGIGLEYWADKLAGTLQKPGFIIVETAQGIPILEDHDHAEGNPHVWLDPGAARTQVRAISEALCKIDPQNTESYRRNTAAYLTSLEALDAQIRQEVDSWQQKSFICFHPSWNYFADRYGLTQAAVIEKRPGFEPNPREMAEIIQIAKKLGVKAIFAEKQFPIKISETIAAEAGAKVIALDPLGQEDAGFSYIKLLQHNVQQMASAMK